MNEEEIVKSPNVVELPDSWWYRVYLGVIAVNILVITALGIFMRYFSN